MEERKGEEIAKMQSATVWTRVRADSEPETVQLCPGRLVSLVFNLQRKIFMSLFFFSSFFLFYPPFYLDSSLFVSCAHRSFFLFFFFFAFHPTEKGSSLNTRCAIFIGVLLHPRAINFWELKWRTPDARVCAFCPI